MKKIILIIVIISSISCKSQTIIPTFSSQERIRDEHHYLKDIDNDFNKFNGIWKYTNGNTSLTLSLNKEEKKQVLNKGMYKDFLVGEYQYIENGIEKVNTLNLINNTAFINYDHNIVGFVIIDNWGKPRCDTCNPNDRRIRAIIKHPTDKNTTHTITLRYINTNRVEKIELKIYGSSADVILLAEGEPDPLDLPVPMGTYILTKQ